MVLYYTVLKLLAAIARQSLCVRVWVCVCLDFTLFLIV